MNPLKRSRARDVKQDVICLNSFSRNLFGKVLVLGLLAPNLAQFAFGASYSVHKNDVIPVKFDGQLSTAESKKGDRFTATVENGDVFPVGTIVEGHVTKVQTESPASIDLVFESVVLPDGTRSAMKGVPIPLTSKYVDKGKDGHYVAKPTVRKSTAVGLGALGGLVLGSLLKRPFEGLFVGTLAGIAVAETAGNGDQHLTIKQGSEAGVLFQNDFKLESQSVDGLGGTVPLGTKGTQPPTIPAPSNGTQAPATGPKSPTAPPTFDSTITLGGQVLSFPKDQAPYWANDVVMVPIESTAKQLQLNYSVAATSLFVENDDHSLRLEQTGVDYRLDGKKDKLPVSVAKLGGIFYAPIDVFGLMLGKKISVDPNGTKTAQ